MPTLTPVDFDPFAMAGLTGGAALRPADRALFAQSEPASHQPGWFDDLVPQRPDGAVQHLAPATSKAPTLVPVDHDPWAQYVAPATPAPATPAAPAQQADPWAQYVQPAPTPGVRFAPPAAAPAATAAPAGPFDDLIPSSPGGASTPSVRFAAPAPAAPAGLFDDLIPKQGAAPVQAEDDDPYTREPATWSDTKNAVDKMIGLNAAAANGVTMGFAPKLGALADSDPLGKLLGTAAPDTPTYERALADRQAVLDRVQRDSPTGSKVAGGAGTLLAALAGGGAVGAAARGVEAVPVLGRVAANPFVQGGVTGTGLGAADAAAHGQPIGSGAALGGAAGVGGAALGSIVGRGVRSLGSLFAARPQVISSPQLQAAARQAYGDAENAGVVYSPAAMDRLNGALRDHMADFGYAPELQPGGAAVLRSLDRSDGMPTTLKGLDQTRRIAGNMFDPMNPSQARLGGGIKGVIDDFTANPRPGDVLMGDQAAGTAALGRARDLYNRASKDQDLIDAIDRATVRAGATGSGGNINNATRQQVRGVLDRRKDWTPDEEAALRGAVKGTPTANFLRLLGKASPEGNGLVPLLEIGGVALSPHAIALPIVGALAKRAADAATARAVANAGQLIRSGGDAAALRVPPNWLQRLGAGAGRPASSLTLGDYLAPSNR